MSNAPRPDDDDNTWVTTSPNEDGSDYCVIVQWTTDVWKEMPRDLALEYAAYVSACAMRAHHDAAVFRQMRGQLGLKVDLAVKTVAEIRATREMIDKGDWPLELSSSVNIDGKPFLHLSIDGEAFGQWSVRDAMDHATGVLAAIASAPLDQSYFRYMFNTVGTSENTARSVVGALSESEVDD